MFDEAAARPPWTEKRRDIEVGAGLSHLAELKGWLAKKLNQTLTGARSTRAIVL
jgi:hypothetical protein